MQDALPIRTRSEPLALSYVVPLRSDSPRPELARYLRALAATIEVIVVDGSPPDLFDAHEEWFGPSIRHVIVDPDRATLNGKVGGVMTGVALASHECVVLADDDVRYSFSQLQRVHTLLHDADVVRPQNRFDPLPWHARWDTGRMLCNRMTGGDWPGTLGVRRSTLLEAGGYAGDVLFENFELVRTVEVAGGRSRVDLSLVVVRVPPTVRQFLDQRVRQAYDEFARPARMTAFLAVAPLVVATRGRASLPLAVGAITVAELGRRRSSGRSAFGATAALWAPLWLAERSITSWVALVRRAAFGGVRYRDVVLKRAATPVARLRP